MAIGDDQKQQFLDALARCGVVGDAMKAAGIKTRAAVKKWREEDPQFSEAYDEAIEESRDTLESAARSRAVDGVVVTKVVGKGDDKRTVDTVTYSDTLLMFLLKGERGDKFADRSKTEITNPDGSLKPENETAAAARIAALLDEARKRREAAGDPLFD